jgi:hypothetical protein
MIVIPAKAGIPLLSAGDYMKKKRDSRFRGNDVKEPR